MVRSTISVPEFSPYLQAIGTNSKELQNSNPKCSVEIQLSQSTYRCYQPRSYKQQQTGDHHMIGACSQQIRREV